MTKRSETNKTSTQKNKNETRDLYYRSPASEKKVNLATSIIISFITLAVGFGVGVAVGFGVGVAVGFGVGVGVAVGAGASTVREYDALPAL